MVARKLRIESLEVRRLFAIDLDSANTNAPTDIPDAVVADETAVFADANLHLFTTSSVDPSQSNVRPAGPNSYSRSYEPSLVETPSHFIVAQPDLSTQTTKLYISSRQADGTADEPAVLKIDMWDLTLKRIGDKVALYTTEYEGNVTPDSPFPWYKTRLIVVDPASREVVYETSFDGWIKNAFELPTSLALEAISRSSKEPEADYLENDGSLVEAKGDWLEPQMLFLYETEEGLQINREAFVGNNFSDRFDDIVITFTSRLFSDPNSPPSVFRFWDLSNNQLREIAAIEIDVDPNLYENWRPIGFSPDGKHFMFEHSVYSPMFKWNYRGFHEDTLNLIEFSKEGAKLLWSRPITPSLERGRWISEHQFLMSGYEPQSELKILDISASSEPTVRKIPLSQPLRYRDHILLDSGHLVLSVNAPSTSNTMNGNIESSTGFGHDTLQPAIVIVDLQQMKVTDVQLLDPLDDVGQFFRITSLPNHFAYRTVSPYIDSEFQEGVQVAAVDQHGKFVNVAETTIGTDWTLQTSDGSSLRILDSVYLEERSWSNLDQEMWSINLDSRDSSSAPYLAPTEPKSPHENLRSGTEELAATGTTPSNAPLDTNGDGVISPIDVLQVINHINRAYSLGDKDDLLNIAANSLNRLDVDGDSKILPTDVIMMIASLNVMHATFESNDGAEVTSETFETPRFWDKLAEEQELSPDLIAASMETLFGNILESSAANSTEDYWTWFAPFDPLADKLKQQWIALDPNRMS